jgi:hypothetical protein
MSRGLKPAVSGAVSVQAEAWTYLRSKDNRRSQEQGQRQGLNLKVLSVSVQAEARTYLRSRDNGRGLKSKDNGKGSGARTTARAQEQGQRQGLNLKVLSGWLGDGPL